MGDPLEDPNEANEDLAENEKLDEEAREDQRRRDEESNLVTPDPDVPLTEDD